MLNVYKKLISYVPEKQYLVYLTIILSIASTFLQLSAFYYLYVFFNELLKTTDPEIITTNLMKIVLLLVLGSLCYMASGLVSHMFAFRLETNLRKYGIEGLSKASFRFMDTNESGKVRKILDDNAALTHAAVAHLIPDNTGASLMPILLIILGLMIDWRVGVVLMVLLVASGVLMYLMMGEKEFMKIYQAALERLSTETVEYIRGMQIVKVFGVDVRSFKALNAAIKDYGQNALDYSMSCKRPYVVFQEIYLGLMAIIIPIWLLFSDLQANPTEVIVPLLMLLFLSGVLFTYMMKVMYIGMYVFQANDAIAKLESIYADMQKDSLTFGEHEEMDDFTIRFDDVSFSYNDKPVLEELTFSLPAGKTYALVGESGSGKSTIAKLISGFYKVQDGSITIGGYPIESYSEECIIKNISFVFQNVQLFKKTLYENVALAKKDANRCEVFHAMHLAGCDSILNKFPEREETMIGSKGVYLSGGEKQRIAIARAILKDAPIVIFDEASAAIDSDNEHQLQQAFHNLMQNKTVIMIAHRLSTIKKVDEIIVLQQGQIIERGTDETLMAKRGTYYQLQELYQEANDWRVTDGTTN
ncbi:ATP-binding cassette, subfamily B [Granulicatella balaenopterae]|uniref:ATP-binding cassette, subfamily B n=1 Tax=Granulicatella balaenopterae TaxID=137733 RepID=A0A1H9IYS9_9LACT|nr:ABC transporter ATP-binding protein [Granulicatella balaenopterae]SEQ79961.1 ATP-binding cassette, subfamily B [Granulicatella balaenopterae]